MPVSFIPLITIAAARLFITRTSHFAMSVDLFGLALATLALAAGAQADTTSTLSASYCSARSVSITGTGTATGVQYTTECEPMVYVESSGKNLSPAAIGAIVGIVVGSAFPQLSAV